jgi:hypothetical protein
MPAEPLALTLPAMRGQLAHNLINQVISLQLLHLKNGHYHSGLLPVLLSASRHWCRCCARQGRCFTGRGRQEAHRNHPHSVSQQHLLELH